VAANSSAQFAVNNSDEVVGVSTRSDGHVQSYGQMAKMTVRTTISSEPLRTLCRIHFVLLNHRSWIIHPRQCDTCMAGWCCGSLHSTADGTSDSANHRSPPCPHSNLWAGVAFVTNHPCPVHVTTAGELDHVGGQTPAAAARETSCVFTVSTQESQ